MNEEAVQRESAPKPGRYVADRRRDPQGGYVKLASNKLQDPSRAQPAKKRRNKLAYQIAESGNIPSGLVYTCDEFPFASSVSGGSGYSDAYDDLSYKTNTYCAPQGESCAHVTTWLDAMLANKGLLQQYYAIIDKNKSKQRKDRASFVKANNIKYPRSDQNEQGATLRTLRDMVKKDDKTDLWAYQLQMLTDPDMEYFATVIGGIKTKRGLPVRERIDFYRNGTRGLGYEQLTKDELREYELKQRPQIDAGNVITHWLHGHSTTTPFPWALAGNYSKSFETSYIPPGAGVISSMMPTIDVTLENVDTLSLLQIASETADHISSTVLVAFLSQKSAGFTSTGTASRSTLKSAVSDFEIRASKTVTASVETTSSSLYSAQVTSSSGSAIQANASRSSSSLARIVPCSTSPARLGSFSVDLSLITASSSTSSFDQNLFTFTAVADSTSSIPNAVLTSGATSSLATFTSSVFLQDTSGLSRSTTDRSLIMGGTRTIHGRDATSSQPADDNEDEDDDEADEDGDGECFVPGYDPADYDDDDDEDDGTSSTFTSIAPELTPTVALGLLSAIQAGEAKASVASAASTLSAILELLSAVQAGEPPLITAPTTSADPASSTELVVDPLNPDCDIAAYPEPTCFDSGQKVDRSYLIAAIDYFCSGGPHLDFDGLLQNDTAVSHNKTLVASFFTDKNVVIQLAVKTTDYAVILGRDNSTDDCGARFRQILDYCDPAVTSDGFGGVMDGDCDDAV